MNLTTNQKRLGKLLIMLVAFFAIMAMGFQTVLKNEIRLNINGEITEVTTYASTVEEFLKNEKIEIKNSQKVEPALNTEITNDMDIKIISSKSFNIKDGNKTIIAETNASTVRDVLKNLDIKLNELDRVNPTLDTLTKKGMNITISRVSVENIQNEVEIPFQVETTENKDILKGEKNIKQTGVVGKRIDTVKNTYVNGEVSASEIIKSEVVAEPINQIEEIGTKVIEAPKGIGNQNVKKVIVMQATAYDPTAGTKTAMGTRARVGAVAVDPKVIPLGSKLYIESMDGFASYGYAVAEDTGGAIKGNRIDLFYNSNAEANRFGRRNVKVYVID